MLGKFFTSFSIIFIAGVQAQATSQLSHATVSPSGILPTQIATTSEISRHQKKNTSLIVDFSADSQLKREEVYSRESHLNFYITPAVTIKDSSAVSLKLGMIKNMYGQELLEFDNPLLTWAKNPMALGGFKETNFDYSVFAVLPGNEKDREEKTLRGGLGVAAGVARSLNLFSRATKGKYTLSVLKNIHEYERTLMREANLSHRVRHIFSLGQPLSKKWNFDILARYQTGWTYQNAFRTSFLISETLSFDLSPTSSVYLEHTNEGSAVGANGVDSNIAVYDKQNSVVSIGMKGLF